MIIEFNGVLGAVQTIMKSIITDGGLRKGGEQTGICRRKVDRCVESVDRPRLEGLREGHEIAVCSTCSDIGEGKK